MACTSCVDLKALHPKPHPPRVPFSILLREKYVFLSRRSISLACTYNVLLFIPSHAKRFVARCRRCFALSCVRMAGWLVAVDVRRGVDEESGPGEDQGCGHGRVHHAHNGLRVLNDLRGHGDGPRHPTGVSLWHTTFNSSTWPLVVSAAQLACAPNRASRVAFDYHRSICQFNHAIYAALFLLGRETRGVSCFATVKNIGCFAHSRCPFSLLTESSESSHIPQTDFQSKLLHSPRRTALERPRP